MPVCPPGGGVRKPRNISREQCKVTPALTGDPHRQTEREIESECEKYIER